MKHNQMTAISNTSTTIYECGMRRLILRLPLHPKAKSILVLLLCSAESVLGCILIKDNIFGGRQQLCRSRGNGSITTAGLMHLASVHPGRLNRVVEHCGYGHRPHPSWNGCYCSSDLHQPDLDFLHTQSITASSSSQIYLEVYLRGSNITDTTECAMLECSSTVACATRMLQKAQAWIGDLYDTTSGATLSSTQASFDGSLRQGGLARGLGVEHLGKVLLWPKPREACMCRLAGSITYFSGTGLKEVQGSGASGRAGKQLQAVQQDSQKQAGCLCLARVMNLSRQAACAKGHLSQLCQ